MASFDTVPSNNDGLNWSQSQDLALITGVDRLGLGNWQDISSLALKSQHSALQCEQRFKLLRLELLNQTDTNKNPVNQSELNSQMKTKSDNAVFTPGSSLIGYTVLRQDFDNVFANEFESQLLQDMTFDKDAESAHCGDSYEEWAKMKLRVLRNYNLRLDEREYRKSVVLRRSLLDFPRMQEVRNRMNNPPADVLVGELDYFAKFGSSYDEFLQFRTRVLQERKLRNELIDLKRAQSLGAKTVEQAEKMKHARRVRIVGDLQDIKDKLVFGTRTGNDHDLLVLSNHV